MRFFLCNVLLTFEENNNYLNIEQPFSCQFFSPLIWIVSFFRIFLIFCKQYQFKKGKTLTIISKSLFQDYLQFPINFSAKSCEINLDYLCHSVIWRFSPYLFRLFFATGSWRSSIQKRRNPNHHIERRRTMVDSEKFSWSDRFRSRPVHHRGKKT